MVSEDPESRKTILLQEKLIMMTIKLYINNP